MKEEHLLWLCILYTGIHRVIQNITYIPKVKGPTGSGKISTMGKMCSTPQPECPCGQADLPEGSRAVQVAPSWAVSWAAYLCQGWQDSRADMHKGQDTARVLTELEVSMRS